MNVRCRCPGVYREKVRADTIVDDVAEYLHAFFLDSLKSRV